MSGRRHSIPDYARSILNALQFMPYGPDFRFDLSDEQWSKALEFCDRSRLTLPLLHKCSHNLPASVRARLESNRTSTELRWERLKSDCQTLFRAFDASGTRFLVLKGFSHCPHFTENPRHRVQYDVDLLFKPIDVHAAAAIATSLGYEAATTAKHKRTDHLPTLIRKTNWTWKDDYFDRDIPHSLELHYRCWDAEAEHFGPHSIDDIFWDRAQRRICEELSFESLYTGDALLYAALHIVRHLLRGSLVVGNVYEVSQFLHRHCDDDEFWCDWARLHSVELGALQGFSFRLAQRWFNCRLHPIAEAAAKALSADISRWLETYVDAPISALFQPNKDELWLHWSLVSGQHTRWLLLRRKLFPLQVPGPVAGLHLRAEQWTWRIRWSGRWRQFVFVCRRFLYHAAALPPTIASGVRWFAGS